MIQITRAQAEDMMDAHDQGFHTPPEGLPREGCPDCEGRELREYPRELPNREDEQR